MHLGLRREGKEDYRKEKVKCGSDYRVVKMMCSLEGDHISTLWKGLNEGISKCKTRCAKTRDRASLRQR